MCCVYQCQLFAYPCTLSAALHERLALYNRKPLSGFRLWLHGRVRRNMTLWSRQELILLVLPLLLFPDCCDHC